MDNAAVKLRCADCAKTFLAVRNLTTHRSIFHHGRRCAVCKRQFATVDDKTAHECRPIRRACDKCGTIYMESMIAKHYRKCNGSRIRERKLNEPLPCPFATCSQCDADGSDARHCSHDHAPCPVIVRTASDMCRHVTDAHDVDAPVEEGTFDTLEEAIEWKESIEESSGVKMVTRYSCKADSARRTTLFVCNRPMGGRRRSATTRLVGSRPLARPRVNINCTCFIRVLKMADMVSVQYCLKHMHGIDQSTHSPTQTTNASRLKSETQHDLQLASTSAVTIPIAEHDAVTTSDGLIATARRLLNDMSRLHADGLLPDSVNDDAVLIANVAAIRDRLLTKYGVPSEYLDGDADV